MRILELAARNLRETYRDPLALAFLLGFPLVFMLLFGAMFTGDNTASYAIGIIDEDDSPVSAAFVSEALSQVPGFELSDYDDASAALEELKLGDLNAYIVIPPGFGEQVSRNWQDEETDIILRVTYDESDITLAQQILAMINSAARAFARIEIPVAISADPIHVETDITYIDFIAPGIIIFGLLIMIPTSARIMVRDKEKGFLSRLLTTPTHPVDFISGYSLCLVAVAAAQIVVFLLVAYLFGMDIVGSLWLAFLIFFLTGLCSIGIGMVVAALSRSENQAEPLCWLFAMPLAMLSGCWFSIEMLPSYLRTAAFAFPYAHAISASRSVLIRGVGMEAINQDFLFLIGWAVAVFAIGIILFRRTMRS